MSTRPSTANAGAAEYDFVIVGAGTCGCIIASRLSEVPSLRVALVEAGGAANDPMIHDPSRWPMLQGSEYDWKFNTEPQPATANRSHPWPRGKAVGGSTCINAMAHVRGHPNDFNAWVEAGCDGWGFANLLPYFIKSETSDFGPSRHHGSNGPVHLLTPADPHPITLAYLAAVEEQGVTPTAEHNGGQLAGPAINTLTIKDGRRQTVADAYLTPEVLGRPNLSLLRNRMVERVCMDRTGRCNGISLCMPGGQTRYINAQAGVILSAGAVGTPVLMLRSGLGPGGDLRKLGIEVCRDLPGVGRNLQDHLLSGGNVYIAKRPVPPSRYQHSESLTYLNLDGPQTAPEIVLACVTVPVTTEAFTSPPVGSAYTIMFGFTHPASRGTIKLRSSDPHTQPVIDPCYLSEKSDIENYRRAMRRARAIGASGALGEWREREYLPETPDLANHSSENNFLQRAAHTHHHPVGTCQMGPESNANSVVDSTLAVRGVRGLYIVDASILPTLTTGPVNAALIAIAERAGDLFRNRQPLAAMDLASAN